MKKILVAALALGSFMYTNAQDLPVPSPYGEVEQVIGLTEVEVEYSRPGVKDREIFGSMLEYGKVWRTGANATTTISFSTDVVINNVVIKEGTYAILSIPGEEKWEVIFNSDLEVQEGSYDPNKNVMTFKFPAEKSSEKTETLTFTFDNVKNNSADLTFRWENVKWSLPIMVKVEEQALKNIDDKIKEIESGSEFRVYNKSARYYLDNGHDLDKALAWSQKSVELDERFWNVYTLSLIQAAKEDYKSALKTAKRSLELAQEAKYEPYIKMNEKNIAEWSKK